MGAYLGKELNDSQIQSLIEFTSFKNMKEKRPFKIEMHKEYFKEDLEFFRKGQIGDWVNYFTEDLSKRVDEAVQKNLEYKHKFNYGQQTSINNTFI